MPERQAGRKSETRNAPADEVPAAEGPASADPARTSTFGLPSAFGLRLSELLPGPISPAALKRSRRAVDSLVSRRRTVIASAAASAARFGFESVGADGGHLASLNDPQIQELLATLKAKRISFGAAGVPKDRQLDGQRELPMATGVIDTGAFLNALNQIGYDGPVRSEPLNQALNALPPDERCAAVAQAMKRAVALVR